MKWLAALRILAAGTLGYGLIVVLTTLGFGTWLGDPSFSQADRRVQLEGALVAVIAGLAGGALAALIGGDRPLRHTLAVLPFLVADSTYVLFFLNPRRDPFLFDLAAALVLFGATLAGGFVVQQLRRTTRPAPDRG